MADSKFSNSNFNFFGIQMKVQQKVSVEGEVRSEDISVSVKEFIETSYALRDLLKLEDDKLQALGSALDELKILSEDNPVKKDEIKDKLISISSIIENAAGSVAATALLSALEASLALLGA